MTVGDLIGGNQVIRDLDLHVDPALGSYGGQEVYIAALEERDSDITAQLADLEHRLHLFGPSASLLRLKVSLELERQACREALRRVSVPGETQ